MNKSINKYRFIIAAGGTGGHLYPAVAVAEEIKRIEKDSEFLFVGTNDKIESRVIPNLGYNFKPIVISGFSRKINLSNLLFPFKLILGSLQALSIVIKYKPQVAIGAGAYVSGPVIWAASVLGSKIVLLEQNSYPGVTNRMLEKKADEIHINFEDSKKYFRDKSKLHLSGNPVRFNLKLKEKHKALDKLGLDKNKKTLLILGGSLGAGSINEAVAQNIEEFKKNGIQLIWQTGKNYYDRYKNLDGSGVKVIAFIDDMSEVYSAADLILARAGATTISEISFLGLPAVFVPSPNVAENHQFKNAKSLVDKDAAELIEDKNLKDELIEKVVELINNDEKLEKFRTNIKSFAKPDSAKIIAERCISLADIV